MPVSQLHFTDTSVPLRLVQPSDAEADPSRDTFNDAGNPELVEGIPFILGDDGTYDLDLNRFFRECPSMGMRSLNSIRAYAHDILTWVRFLAERRGGKSLWRADRQDIIAFHRTRRLAAGPGQITASSWNRSDHRLGEVLRLGRRRGSRRRYAIVAGGDGRAKPFGATPDAAAFSLFSGAGRPAARHALHRHGPVHPVP